MTDKLSVLPTKDKDEMIAACEALKRQMPILAEYAQTVARIRKESFDAHIEEGFTPQQALELCKSIEL